MYRNISNEKYVNRRNRNEVDRRHCKIGIPKTLVTDNDSQYTSERLKNFIKRNGVKHLKSPPYNPSSNGLVENTMKSFKNKNLTNVTKNCKAIWSISHYNFVH